MGISSVFATAFAAGFLLATGSALAEPDKHPTRLEPQGEASARAEPNGGKAAARKSREARRFKKKGRTRIDLFQPLTGARTLDIAAAGAFPTRSGYRALISRYASIYGVPMPLAHAVIAVESNYRANARGKAGEVGLMQIKPATARLMGYSGQKNGLFDPETNIKYGMKYLGMAHQLSGGNTCGTILRYNAGHGARRMNPISAAYCSRVKGML